MVRYKFFPQRKQFCHRKSKTDTLKFITSPVPNPSLPNYSSVNPTPNDYPTDNNAVNNEIESSAEYLKTIYSFCPPLF